MRAEAVVFAAPGVVEFREVTCPEPGPDDLVVRLRHSWISTGTESSYLRGERVAGDTPRAEGDPWPFPIVAGYQKTGIVEWVGEDVADVEPGEVVFASWSRVNNMFEPIAGHVSPSVIARSRVWRIPQDRDPLAYAGLVLTQVGYNCGTRAPVAVGDPAVVVGDGLVGHWAAQTLAWRGADVLLVGRHRERLQRFREDARRHTALATGPQETLDVIDAAFPDGVVVVVDAAGCIPTLQATASRARRGGQVVSAGFYGNDDRLALQPLREHELGVQLVAGWAPRRMADTVGLVTGGELETLPLITHHFPAATAADAWRMIQDRTEPFLGVVLTWD